MNNSYLILALYFLIGAFCSSLSRSLIKKLLEKLSESMTKDIQEKVKQFSLSSFQIIILCVFLWFGINLTDISTDITLLLEKSLYLLIGYACILISYDLLDVLEIYVIRLASNLMRDSLRAHAISYAKSVLKVLIVAVVILLILQNMGFNVTSLLASLGIGGLALALGAKETLGNLFDGVSIIFDEPFSVGDWIVCNKVEGVVENIGFRSTKIKTFYDSVIIVPNSIIAHSIIDNVGKRKSRRTRFTLDLTYNTPPKKIESFIEGVKQILKKNEFIKQDSFQVYFNSYAASSLQILVNFFLKVNNWDDELLQKQRIFLDILKLSEEEGVSFAFPTQTLDIPHQFVPQNKEIK